MSRHDTTWIIHHLAQEPLDQYPNHHKNSVSLFAHWLRMWGHFYLAVQLHHVLTTSKGPYHFDLSFPRNNFSRELKSNTLSPILKIRATMCLSCHLLTSLYKPWHSHRCGAETLQVHGDDSLSFCQLTLGPSLTSLYLNKLDSPVLSVGGMIFQIRCGREKFL